MELEFFRGTQLEFHKTLPPVIYEYLGEKGYIEQRWEFRWTGIFGKGYYQLTKNGRKHPKGNFKVIEQVYREAYHGDCKVEKK